MDNIDIMEEFCKIYAEDYWDNISVARQRQIGTITATAIEFIGKMYPVLYADEFELNKINEYDSACWDKDLLQKRKNLI